MSNFTLDDNTAVLWSESKVKVVFKGKIKYKASDGIAKEVYGSILKFENREGQTKYELARSVGLLHYNSEEDKKNPKTPDINGKVTLDDSEFKFGSWIKVSERGTEYLFARLEPQEEYEQRQNLTPSKEAEADF
tara:strand:- start:2547 stop:2948 length:402 start_codon:yes stop_codon:yes gene_type:complete